MHFGKKLNMIHVSDGRRRIEVTLLLLSLMGFISMTSIYLFVNAN